MQSPTDTNSAAGQAVYSPWVLALYDWYVLGFSNSMVWQCPSARLLDWYERHVSNTHLDVGVGTGWFLDRCRYPSGAPNLTLMDLNPNSLAHTARRIARHRPRVVQADVFGPLPSHLGTFDSIGLNFLLHCLPEHSGNTTKWQTLASLGAHLEPGGTLFGSTIIGPPKTLPQRTLMRVYNRKGIFGNHNDTREALETTLRQSFARVEVEQRGLVVLFAAHKA